MLKYTKKILEDAAVKANSYKELMDILGFSVDSRAGNLQHIKSRIKHHNISIDHFKRPELSFTKNTPLIDLLENKVPIKSSALKTRLLNNKYLENKCAECGQPPVWNNKSLTLQLDHIDGNHLNNNLSNLRILCPNCHTQTETWCGKNVNRIKQIFHSKPAKEILEELIWKVPSIKIAEEFGVSRTTVINWCKYYGISKPDNSYWKYKSTKEKIKTNASDMI